MASIYELAQRINKQKQQGSGNEYFDNAMQIMNYLDKQDEKKNAMLKDDATILNNMIQGASTEEEMNNMLRMTNKYSEDTAGRTSLNLHREVIASNARERRDAYMQGKQAMDWVDLKMNEEVPDYNNVYEAVSGFETGDRALRHNNPGAHIWTPELANKYGATQGDPFTVKEDDGTGNFIEKTYNTAHYEDRTKGAEASQFIVKKLWDASGKDVRKFVKSYSGSSDADTLRGYEDAVNSKVGKGSYFNYSVKTMQDWSLDEIEARIRELDKFEKGMGAFKSNKFEYGKGSYADVTLMKEYDDYKQKLDATMKAHLTAGVISEEEALSIMRGTYKQDKTATISLIDKNISKIDTQIAKLSKARLDQMSEDAKGAFMMELAEEGITGADLQSKINEKLTDLRLQRNKEKARRYKWTGIEGDAMGADFMEHNQGGRDKGELLKEIEKEEDLPVGIKRPKPLVYSPLHQPSKGGKTTGLTLYNEDSLKDQEHIDKVKHVDNWDEFNKKVSSEKRELEKRQKKIESLRERGYNISEEEYNNISSQLEDLNKDIETATQQIELAGGKDYARYMKKILKNKKKIRDTALQILEDTGAPKTKKNFKNAIIEAKRILLKERGDSWGTKTHSQRVPGARTPFYRTGSLAARP